MSCDMLYKLNKVLRTFRQDHVTLNTKIYIRKPEKNSKLNTVQ